ncbi:acidic mammalian chitinase-like [Gordionus sp. m RMFG-2023]|uniref:acidic mammalian chitinase-like n=1 Tax=Gordionus sp. m RMFG-2023 TaxID=3053472 RepID=UPI0031FC5486
MTAVPASFQKLMNYDIQKMNKYVDFFGAMTYNFHGSWESYTGHNSPLYSNDNLNSVAVINYLINNGADVAKILLGIPFYGRNYKLIDEVNKYVGAPAYYGGGPPGDYTGEAGTMSYYEIMLKKPLESFDYEAKVPFGYIEDMWISYENGKSITYKMNYVCNKNIGGIMIWELSMDDIDNPLLISINKFLTSTFKCKNDIKIEKEIKADYYKILEDNSSISNRSGNHDINTQYHSSKDERLYNISNSPIKTDTILGDKYLLHLCQVYLQFSVTLIPLPKDCRSEYRIIIALNYEFAKIL